MSLHWFQWLYIALTAIHCIYYTLQIGQERMEVTPGLAAGEWLFSILIVLGLVYYWGK